MDVQRTINDAHRHCNYSRPIPSRQVTSKALAYPYRDDAVRIWDAIVNYVTEFIGEFYASDSDVLRDVTLQGWALEIVTKGGVQDFGEPSYPHIRTRESLIDSLAMVIFTASAQHAAVNFPQVCFRAPCAFGRTTHSKHALLNKYCSRPHALPLQAHEMSFVPAYPAAIFKSPSDILLPSVRPEDLLPSVAPSKEQIELLGVLGGVHYSTLGSQSIWEKLVLLFEVRLAWDCYTMVDGRSCRVTSVFRYTLNRLTCARALH